MTNSEVGEDRAGSSWWPPWIQTVVPDTQRCCPGRPIKLPEFQLW